LPLINRVKAKTYFDDYLQSDDSSSDEHAEDRLSNISIDDYKDPIEQNVKPLYGFDSDTDEDDGASEKVNAFRKQKHSEYLKQNLKVVMIAYTKS
jgi:hypothetical protein